jgi:hypothetical protein
VRAAAPVTSCSYAAPIPPFSGKRCFTAFGI